MRGSDFAELTAFAAIAERGNFARAASALRVSPSGLSQTIRRLEKRLGMQLLNRTSRSVALTEAGVRLLARLAPALADLETAVDGARAAPGAAAGTVRVQVPWPAFHMLIEPLLGAFSEAHPAVVLDLTLEDATLDLTGSGFDIGIRLGEKLQQDMVGVALGGPLRQVAVASPAYLARHGTPQTPDDLLHHRCINWRWPGQMGLYGWEFMRDGAWFSVAVDGPLIVSHRDAALRAALQGVGIAFWNDRLVAPHVAAGRLVMLLQEFSPPFPGWHMTFLRQRHMPDATRAFVDFMRRNASA